MLIVLGSALVMWWPVVSPLPEMPPLAPPGQMLYLFVQSLAPTIPASFLTFGTTPLYPVYATFPRIWGISAMTDQLIAGLIMKIVGGLILWGVIAVDLLPVGARASSGGLGRAAVARRRRRDPRGDAADERARPGAAREPAAADRDPARPSWP